MDFQRHFVKYDLVNLLQDIHKSAFYKQKIMVKRRYFIFSDYPHGLNNVSFYDIAVFCRAVLWFVLF